MRDLLIGVTDFLRDPAAFQALETLAVPKLFEDKRADDEVRVGLPVARPGRGFFHRNLIARAFGETVAAAESQIFATDIDEVGMGIARTARYPAGAVKEIRSSA